MTTVHGPITGGNRGWPFGASMTDLNDVGYSEAEYFIKGESTRYKLKEGSELSTDGQWDVEPAGTAPFKTRFIVYRPNDATRFNGSVVVTWNNVTAGHDLFGAESREIFEGGFVLVCATTQKVGIEGLPPVNQGLAGWDPERYGDLHIASDDYSYDILTQVALAVGSDRPSDNDPLAGLDVRNVIAQGASQSAGRLGTYINAIAPLNEAIDGFILTIYFGRGTPLEVGETVVNINTPENSAAPEKRLRGANLLRTDLGKPIFVVNSELEAIACHGVRQPDTDTMRFWESAGTCHVSQQGRAARQAVTDRDELVTQPPVEGINAIPMNPLYDAAYHHMHRWLSEGVAPPVQPRVNFEGESAEVVRDEFGIATAGVRLPQADVPVATNSAVPLTPDIRGFLDGSSQPFTRDKLNALYGDRSTFVSKFTEAANNAVNCGVLMPREVARLVDEAGTFWDAAS